MQSEVVLEVVENNSNNLKYLSKWPFKNKLCFIMSTIVTRIKESNNYIRRKQRSKCQIQAAQPRVDITVEDAPGAIKREITGPHEMGRVNSSKRPTDALYYNEARA